MERIKELLRLLAVFCIALLLGFILSEKLNNYLLYSQAYKPDQSPLQSLPFDEEDLERLDTENTPPTENTRPMLKTEPPKMLSNDKAKPTISPQASLEKSKLKGDATSTLSPQDKALLFDKNEFTDNEHVQKKEEDSGEDFFETEYDLDHLVKKSQQSDAEKAFNANMNRMIEAQKKMTFTQDSLSDLNRYKVDARDTQRFGLKLQLPEDNEALKLKFQYREAPEFGASANVPELILPTVKQEESGFIEIERSKTSESPWDNFDSTTIRGSGLR